MGQFFKVLGNLVFGVTFAMMFFLLTFEPKEFIQYAGLIIGIGVAFTMSKLNTDEINNLQNEIDNLQNEIDKLKKNNENNENK